MSHFGILSSFDHSLQNWATYKSRIAQWFIANDIGAKTDGEGVKRRAILLSALADNTYKLTADLALPRKLEEVAYEEILKLLDKHFTPKVCGFGERHKFYAAVQEPGETPSQWAARLRGLTAHCNFGKVEEALRDRFVMGMSPGPEKEKLFAQDVDTLDLAKAVELAESVRSARLGAAAAAQPQQDQLFKISPRPNNSSNTRAAKEKCSVCGYTNHKASQCRFASYKCKKCNTKGHLRRMCKVNVITSEVGESDDDGKLFVIRANRGEPMTEFILLNGVRLKFEIDSGSGVTVMSEKTFKSHFKDVPLSTTNKRLCSYTGDRINCIGVARLPAAYLGRTHSLDVYVVRDGGPPLLGRDFISLFNLQLSPCNYVSDTPASALSDQLKIRYPHVFSDKLGKFNKYTVKLRLKDNAKPIFFKARPVAFALRDKVGKEIDRLVELGVLKQVDSAEYASPIVPVLKHNGAVRLCADYSVTINKQLIVDQYPLPTINELFSKLHGGKQFSKLDLSMAYNQFVLDEESQNITCINTHRGIFKYTRLVFGLASAPAIFQRAMENVLSGMDGVLCLLDDVLITAPDKKTHLERLYAVLDRLQNAGLTLQKEKCDFFKDEISYLGYVINQHGLKKSPDKIKAIVDAPLPTDVNKLQSFLGLVNYYRNFVPGASSILSPLYDLLKKGVKWHWSESHDKAFKMVKNILASEQVLTHFDPKAKLILTVDASPSGLGAILSQVGSDGLERPISFASRTLNSAEKRYSQIQKEATAIIYGVRRYHQYLYGRSHPFILRTDHKPLISIFGPYKGVPEVSANRLQRYAMFLSAYNYSIEYIRSGDNSADYLSRASLPEPQEEADAGAVGARAAEPVDRASYINFVVEGSMPVTLDVLREETAKDDVLSVVIQNVLNGWPSKVKDAKLIPYYLCRTQLSFENGCLMRGHKVVIPLNLQESVIKELHSSHLGIVKTKAEARSRFWFPGVDAALEKMVSSCDVCLQLRPTPPRAPLAPWKYPSKPFCRLHIDFLGPVNSRMFLVIVDAHTKWLEVYEMGNVTTTLSVVEKLYDFMSRFGLPHTIVSDNGTAFTSQEFRNFCSLNGIIHMTSPAYHPASNGQAESFVKIVKRGLKSSLLTSSNVKFAKLNLLKFLFDYRNSVHSVTGVSPAELVYGRKLRSRLDLFSPIQSSAAPTSLENIVTEKQCLQSKNYGGKNKQCFSPGDKVLYKKHLSNNKFHWCKGTVIEKIGKVLYVLKDSLSNLIVRKHKNQIVMYKGNSVPPNNTVDLDYETVTSSTPSPPPDVQEPQAQLVEGERSDGELLLPNNSTNETHTVAEDNQVCSRNPTRLLRNIPRVDYKQFL